jgi:hypothetical protein
MSAGPFDLADGRKQATWTDAAAHQTPPAEPASAMSTEALDKRLAALPARLHVVQQAVRIGQPQLDEAHNTLTRRVLRENRSRRSRGV